MIVRAPGGDVELRDMFSGMDVIPTPAQGTLGNSFSSAGRRVSVEGAAGLPAVMSGIRALAETVGAMPLLTYRETPQGRVMAPDAEQFNLLAKKPNDIQTPFALYSYLVASLNGWGGAFVQKMKVNGRVVALYPMDPARIKVTRDGMDLTFTIRVGGKDVDLTRRDVLYVPGILLHDPYIGSSPIKVHANAIGAALATEEYAGRFYANDATPSGALILPYSGNTQQARDQREVWEDKHRGAPNAHRVAVLFDGATYQQIGVNAADAQIVESQKWNVDQVARCLRIPAWVIGGADLDARLTPEQKNMQFVQLSLIPWMTRIAQAFNADEDLFTGLDDLCCAFDSDALQKADMGARFSAYTQGRQAGWLSANDIRIEEGRQPIEGGDEYQKTPVGGEANLQPKTTADPNAEVPQ